MVSLVNEFTVEANLKFTVKAKSKEYARIFADQRILEILNEEDGYRIKELTEVESDTNSGEEGGA